MFVNSAFRRRPNTTRQAAGVGVAVLLRLIAWPFIALMAIGPIVGSGFLAWTAIAEEHPQNLVPLLAGITLLWQFVSVNGMNIAASITHFRSVVADTLSAAVRPLPGVADPAGLADTEHDCGVPGADGGSGGDRRGETRLGATRSDCSGDLRIDEHFFDTDD